MFPVPAVGGGREVGEPGTCPGQGNAWEREKGGERKRSKVQKRKFWKEMAETREKE